MVLTSIEHEILRMIKHFSYLSPLPRKIMADQLRLNKLMISKDDRQMRIAIEELRKKGYLVCHRKGKGGGYFLAMSLSEYAEFRDREYKKRIKSIADTMRKMDNAAERQFGEAVQLELFYL